MDLTAAVEAFGLGVPAAEPVRAARGAMGEIFRVHTDRGSFALKRLFDWNRGDGAEAEAAFTAVVRAHGVVTPVELRTPAGDLVADIQGGRFRAYGWLDVGAVTEPPRPVDVLAELGRIVGVLHSIAPATELPVDEWYVQSPPIDGWDELIAGARQVGASWAGALAAAMAAIAAETDWVDTMPSADARICHRDLDPTNVLPLGDGRLAVLDWENLGPLPPDRELAALLFDWTSNDERQAGQVPIVRDCYLAAGGTVARLDRSSFDTLVIMRLNHLYMQVRAALDPATEPGHADFANAVIPQLLPDLRDLDRMAALADAFNAR